MQFGISKCAMLVVWRGKVTKIDGIRMPDEKLRSWKRVKATNIFGYWKVIKCSVEKLNPMWRRNISTELRNLDRKTKKYLSRFLYNAFHPRESVARVYLPRNGGGPGLIAVEDSVELSKASLAKYVSESIERMLSAAGGNMKWIIEESNEIKRRKGREKTEEVSNKKVEQFLMEMDEIDNENNGRSWLRRGYLKKETKGLLVAAKSKALRTNAIKVKIDKSQGNSLCRLCHQKNETVNFIVSECPQIAQTWYKRRHDTVAKTLGSISSK